jgi:hypothetical protein
MGTLDANGSTPSETVAPAPTCAKRGLLPPAGQNVGSPDINEYLRTRESDA